MGWQVFYCFLACCMILTFAWLWAIKIKNAAVVDFFWAYNFTVIAIILLWLAPGLEIRKIIICTMVIISGLRLGTFLAFRILSEVEIEEGRYKQLRKGYGAHVNSRFFLFFQMQAASNVLLSIPFFIITYNSNLVINVLEYSGFAVWFLSLIGESIADRQLSVFKSDPRNKGKVCQKGLWYYSRHPNYFFQWCMWLAYFLFALGSPHGYLAIFSPVVMLYLILKVTGIPPAEAQAIKTKGEAYRQYQKTTSSFIPWVKTGFVKTKNI